jgi:hypothetical protein
VTAAAELVAVESIRPGDEVAMRELGLHVVSDVDVDDDGSVVVFYFRRGQQAFENRAGRTGRSTENILIELAIRGRRVGDRLPVVRGRPERAAELRAEMERAQELRWERWEERHRL